MESMEIKRDIMEALLQWKQRSSRKPLIIQGARQTGKTWVMKKFGEECFDYVAYFNAESFSPFLFWVRIASNYTLYFHIVCLSTWQKVCP